MKKLIRKEGESQELFLARVQLKIMQILEPYDLEKKRRVIRMVRIYFGME